ncbi:hypothetical protein [Streptomyces sp. NPDC056227]|uniref:hypothetical protein n=1 Tax=Streptomyces sp. NPDC056227 TaxID=3345753 RepID=UPI0035D8C8D2
MRATILYTPCGPRHGLSGSRDQAGRPKRHASPTANDGEERQATPGIGFLLQLAQAPETTVAELTGSTTELPAQRV